MTINAAAGPSRGRIDTLDGDLDADPYVIPEAVRSKRGGSGKLRLKQTNAERAEQIRQEETARLKDIDARIARANAETSIGSASSSSRSSRADVYGYDPARIQVDEIDAHSHEIGGEDWEVGSDGEEDFVVLGSIRGGISGQPKRQQCATGSFKRRDDGAEGDTQNFERNRARLPNPSHDKRSRMSDDQSSEHVPRRHRRNPSPPLYSSINSIVPPRVLDQHGNLDDDAYLALLRSDHNRTRLQEEREARRQAELESFLRRAERERAAAAALEQEKKRDKKRRKVEKERRAAEAQKKAEEGQRKAKEAGEAGMRWKESVRARYLAKWARVYGQPVAGAGAAASKDAEGLWSFAQVPWPIYPPRTADSTSTRPITLDLLTPAAIKAFLLDMPTMRSAGSSNVRAEGADTVSMRKILGKAIQQMHPDRATTRLLPRVRAADREAVREGVELCARILNALKDAE